ncbi:hypothetical protein [Pseudomonas aeruginosa]|uniref:hypothetical protein n=1 Tax=Pseudomonas aeruginosa TaxID=287 RepID=UPI0010110287|nr:hypothetical protein [Pseudomonas aeruginosa]
MSMRTLFPLLVGVVLAGFSGLAAQAAPAPFYKWQSKLDGQVACRQTSPGDGWVRLDGPYRDLRCREPLR